MAGSVFDARSIAQVCLEWKEEFAAEFEELKAAMEMVSMRSIFRNGRLPSRSGRLGISR